MIVAFLDLLGFSNLLESDLKIAIDNLNLFNNTIFCKKIDEKHYEKARSVSSFSYVKSVSDSLILGSDNPDLFIIQLCDYFTTVYIESTVPFRNEFTDIKEVSSDRNTTIVREGNKIEINSKGAFPVLFRGGISFGDECPFFEENQIINGKMVKGALNVTGPTYLKAVQLEKSGKGPRLFCDKKVADKINDKSIIKEVNAEKSIYEIIWTVRACEKLGCSPGILIDNSVYKTLVNPALNLYRYYWNYYYHSENKEGKKIIKQYEELVRLVCRGSLIYARKKSDQEYREVFNALSKILVGYPELKNILEI